MKKFSEYNIELRNVQQNSSNYEFVLNDRFFADLETFDIHKGNITVIISVKKSVGAYLLDFHIEGKVTVTCDRCLDDLELLVCTDNTLKVKLGADYSEEDDLIIVPEEEGFINVAWFIYEFVTLSLPMKKVHALGGCNESMMKVLEEHNCVSSVEPEDEEWTEEDSEIIMDEDRKVDPRWNDLKKILDNN